jgi:hypothetical protein
MEGQRRAARGVAGSFNEQPTESGPVTRPQEDDHGSQEEDGVARSRRARRKPASGELMAPRGDKRYVRRDSKGRIAKSVEVGRSLSADRRRKAKGVAKRGQGDRGDERR